MEDEKAKSEFLKDHDYIKLNDKKVNENNINEEKSVNIDNDIIENICNPKFMVWHEGFAFITVAVHTHCRFLKCRKHKLGCRAEGKITFTICDDEGEIDIFHNIHNHEDDNLSQDLRRFVDALLEAVVEMPFNIQQVYSRVSGDFPAECYLVPIKNVFHLLKEKRRLSGRSIKYEKVPHAVRIAKIEDRGTWYDGYLFLSSGNVHGFKYLKCKERGCPARGKIPLFGENRQERIDIYKPEHNHPRAENEEERRKFHNELKKAAATRLNDSLQLIYEDVSSEFEHVPNKKNFISVRQTMKRARDVGLYNDTQNKKLKESLSDSVEVSNDGKENIMDFLVQENSGSDDENVYTSSCADTDSDSSFIEDSYTKILLKDKRKLKQIKEPLKSDNDNKHEDNISGLDGLPANSDEDEIIIIQPMLMLKPKIIIKTKSDNITDATFNLTKIPNFLAVPEINFTVPTYSLDVLKSDVEIIAAEDFPMSSEVEIITPQTDEEESLYNLPEMINTSEEVRPFIMKIPVPFDLDYDENLSSNVDVHVTSKEDQTEANDERW